jgi:3-phenylpropionate/trans-cinnamate dioxygenase ferredoxin reductase component
MINPLLALPMVIVGGGQAGGQLASELRALGYTGAITLVSEEPCLPYKRPPLSKAYLAGSVARESLYVTPQASFDKAGIEFIGGVRASHIDRKAKQLALADGRRIGYQKLALCTGSRARQLNLPGADGPRIFPLRTLADVDAIRACCAAGRRAVIIGGGFIGLEAAAVLRKLDMQVTVLEGLPRVLARVTVPTVSAFYERIHREAGVDLRTGVRIEGFESAADTTRVLLGDGSRIEADCVIVGIGIVPNVELAQECGLAVDNGILVDEYARTEDPDIVAAGDCTNHPSAFLGRRLRLESVPNALEQSRVAARTLMGRAEPYNSVPWFWSDQYDLKLQMVGISAGFDQVVVRGDPSTQRSFIAFYLLNGTLIAADAVSRPQDFILAKKLVAEKAVIDPARLADEAVPLKSLAPAASA